MAMRRPAAAPKATVMRRPAASVPFDAFSLDSWKKSLDLGNEPDVGRYITSFYLVAFSRVLASTLGTRPDLRDPASLEREEIRSAVFDAFENPMASCTGRPRTHGKMDLRRVPAL